MSKLRAYDNMEDDTPENFVEDFPVREACLVNEDKFDLLNETEMKKKQENIQAEKAARAGIRNNDDGNSYDWSWVTGTSNEKIVINKE